MKYKDLFLSIINDPTKVDHNLLVEFLNAYYTSKDEAKGLELSRFAQQLLAQNQLNIIQIIKEYCNDNNIKLMLVYDAKGILIKAIID